MSGFRSLALQVSACLVKQCAPECKLILRTLAPDERRNSPLTAKMHFFRHSWSHVALYFNSKKAPVLILADLPRRNRVFPYTGLVTSSFRAINLSLANPFILQLRIGTERQLQSCVQLIICVRSTPIGFSSVLK